MELKPTPELFRVMAEALQGRRNRFGKIEADHLMSERLRPYFKAANPPNGGEDIADQCAMILHRLAGDEPKSLVRT